MEKTAMKVFLACAFGAFIGSMVALQLNHYFWWLGLVIGGFAGYISYEFGRVKTAVPQAWRAATKIGKKEIPLPEIKKVGIIIATFLAFYLGCMGIGFCLQLNMYLLEGERIINPNININDKILVAMPVTGFISGFSFLGFSFALLSAAKKVKSDNFYDLSKKETGMVIGTLLAPILFFPILVLYIAYLVLPPATKLIIRFAKHLFILIHSDIHLLCAADAAIGTGIGYFSGSAIIGALAGGIFGVINYKVVSQHILHLQPKT